MIFLDALLDTRLACIKMVGSDWAKKVLDTGDYMARASDRFSELVPGFPDAAYEQCWNTRNEEIMNSEVYPTYLLPFIASMFSKETERSAVNPTFKEVNVIINTYPYEIDEIGKEWLRTLSIESFGKDCKVCNIPIHLLTPGVIGDQYDDIFMYEFDKWLSMHGEALMDYPIPEVKMYAPLLTQKKVPNNYDLIKDKDMMETSFAGHLDIIFLNASSYCMCVAESKEEK